jgi:hypothetical protein
MKTDVMTYFGHFARSAVYYKAGSPFSWKCHDVCLSMHTAIVCWPQHWNHRWQFFLNMASYDTVGFKSYGFVNYLSCFLSVSGWRK